MQTSIDFSKITRIEPKPDSWDKVSARLDAKADKKSTLFYIYSAIPLAASFILISLTVLLSFFKPCIQQPITIPDDEISVWYNDLDENEEEAPDELELYNSISLLIEEDKSFQGE